MGKAWKTALNQTPQNQYHVFFMKGRNPTQLSTQQQETFIKMIDQEPLSESFLIYDQAQIQTKMRQWKENLPWIQPFYAIKSNPIQPLLTDL